MYVSPGTLAMHLEILASSFEFVHLDEWLQAVAAGRLVPLRACAITFDDGWRDNFDHAWPILRGSQVPATIYLVSDLVGTRYSFWPNTLARFLAAANSRADWPGWLRERADQNDGRPLDADAIDAVIMRCKAAFSDAEMQARLRELEAGTAVAPRDVMSWDEVETLHRSGLVRFGSHTRRHTRLSTIADGPQLHDEVIESKRLIAERLGAPVNTFCYPNGDTTPEAIACVRRHYVGAVTTRLGWNGPGSDLWTLCRVGVHEDIAATPELFQARLSGLL